MISNEGGSNRQAAFHIYQLSITMSLPGGEGVGGEGLQGVILRYVTEYGRRYRTSRGRY